VGRFTRGGRRRVIDPYSSVDGGSAVAGTTRGASRAPVDGGVGLARDDDPGALTSYVGEVAGTETFTFATSRTFCVLDKVLVALGRTKVVYSLYIYSCTPPLPRPTRPIYMRLYIVYIYATSPLQPPLRLKVTTSTTPPSNPLPDHLPEMEGSPLRVFIYMYLL